MELQLYELIVIKHKMLLSCVICIQLNTVCQQTKAHSWDVLAIAFYVSLLHFLAKPPFDAEP